MRKKRKGERPCGISRGGLAPSMSLAFTPYDTLLVKRCRLCREHEREGGASEGVEGCIQIKESE